MFDHGVDTLSCLGLQSIKESFMPATFHIKDTKDHFHFIPEAYRDEVKIALLVPAGLACLTLFILMGLHS